jgi:hypothetical protein
MRRAQSSWFPDGMGSESRALPDPGIAALVATAADHLAELRRRRRLANEAMAAGATAPRGWHDGVAPALEQADRLLASWTTSLAARSGVPLEPWVGSGEPAPAGSVGPRQHVAQIGHLLERAVSDLHVQLRALPWFGPDGDTQRAVWSDEVLPAITAAAALVWASAADD